MSKVGKFTEIESRLVAARNWGEGKWQRAANGQGVSFAVTRMPYA